MITIEIVFMQKMHSKKLKDSEDMLLSLVLVSQHLHSSVMKQQDFQWDLVSNKHYDGRILDDETNKLTIMITIYLAMFKLKL